MQDGEKYREGISKGEREIGKKGELGERGENREKRERERENIKANEEKTSTFPLQLRPSRHPLFIPVRPFFLPHLPPLLVPLSLHLPPRASSVLGTHGYHQRQCGHEAERKELQG